MAAADWVYHVHPILDELLGSGRRTFQELLARVNQRLHPDFKPIGKRTLLRDLDFLVDEKSAPVHRPTKADNFYCYTGKFSLKNIPIDQDELASLRNAIDILKQVDNFSVAQEVDYVIRKLENRLNVDGPDEHIYVQFERHTSHEELNILMNFLMRSKAKMHSGFLINLILKKSPLKESFTLIFLKSSDVVGF